MAVKPTLNIADAFPGSLHNRGELFQLAVGAT